MVKKGSKWCSHLPFTAWALFWVQIGLEDGPLAVTPLRAGLRPKKIKIVKGDPPVVVVGCHIPCCALFWAWMGPEGNTLTVAPSRAELGSKERKIIKGKAVVAGLPRLGATYHAEETSQHC